MCCTTVPLAFQISLHVALQLAISKICVTFHFSLATMLRLNFKIKSEILKFEKKNNTEEDWNMEHLQKFG